MTIRRGLDPRDFVLVAYGGGGPLHAVAIARELAIPTVLVPPTPGNFSAIGMLLMDLRRDSSRTLVLPLGASALDQMESDVPRPRARSEEAIAAEEGAVQQVVFRRFAEMRYRGQQNTVKVLLPEPPATVPTRSTRCAAASTRPTRCATATPRRTSRPGRATSADGPRRAAPRDPGRSPARRPLQGDAPTERRVYFSQTGEYVTCPVYPGGARRGHTPGRARAGRGAVVDDAAPAGRRAGRERARAPRAADRRRSMAIAPRVADAVTVEVVRHTITAIADEMEAEPHPHRVQPDRLRVEGLLRRAARHQGQMIGQAMGSLPVFLCDLGNAIQDILRVYGLERIEPGDMFASNDPTVFGQHLNNVVITLPIFWEGRVVAFTAVRAHWVDIGGKDPAAGTPTRRRSTRKGCRSPR